MRTPLHEKHVELGAKVIDFAGWEMPVAYEGILEEHSAVRTHAGMFDVSHMGEVEVEGPGALAFLQRVLSNDVAAVPVRGAQYSCLCNEQGGVREHLLPYRLPPARGGATNSQSVPTPPTHGPPLPGPARGSRDFDAAVRDVADRYAMLAV